MSSELQKVSTCFKLHEFKEFKEFKGVFMSCLHE